jgi:hypothetical protein
MFAPASTLGNNGDEVGDQFAEVLDLPSTFGVAHWICKISEICMGIKMRFLYNGNSTLCELPDDIANSDYRFTVEMVAHPDSRLIRRSAKMTR